MSMSGYTKLFNSILASTIWREDDKTRLVWITLLAMADKNGVAEGSVPGLADMARVSIEDCEEALRKLMAPDKYSRTKENAGKRIKEVEGGWAILNHAKYRAKMSTDERREYNRLKQQEFRQKASTRSQQTSITVNDSQSQSEMSMLSADTEAKAKASPDTKNLKKNRSGYRSLSIEEFEKANAPKGSPSQEELFAIFQRCPLVRQRRPDLMNELINLKFHREENGRFFPIFNVEGYVEGLEEKFRNQHS